MWHSALYKQAVKMPPRTLLVWDMPPGRSRESMSSAFSRFVRLHHPAKKYSVKYYARTMFIVRLL